MAGEQYELSLTGASPPQAASTMSSHEVIETRPPNPRLHRQTLRKLDFVLLPFLALLFLFNALDKSNIGNAESADFTSDIGLDKGDLNTAVALFFAFFVALQPAGAALGRKYGMVRWVPSCMLVWGISTALHVWIKHRWQLFLLRIIIGAMEAGFYSVTVAYLSLFYTRFEFGRRLSLFYGQVAVGGALGGILSYFVFSRFADEHDANTNDVDTGPRTGWRPWQILFLLEGCMTILVALVGYFWLPHNAETAWFLTPEEKEYASIRVIEDRDMQADAASPTRHGNDDGDYEDDLERAEESRGLLSASKPPSSSGRNAFDDRGLSPHDVISAFLNIKIWHILICNVLSAVPVYAFSVFLPLVLAPLTDSDNPALVNLLTAPPYIFGAIVLYIFASYSDRHRKRIVPVLVGLAIVIFGLTLVVSLPETKDWAIPRYLALNVLLSGTFIASPLTVAWISGNAPSPGKRTLLLGINGWGNLAGVLSAILFKPQYAEFGYIVPFWWTLGCVGVAAFGYVLFLRNLKAENAERKYILSTWDERDIARERLEGRGPLEQDHQWVKPIISALRKSGTTAWMADWLEEGTQGSREGDEKITFIYGL